MPNNEGWIKLYRKIRDSKDWPGVTGERYTSSEAWIDLLLSANHANNTINGITIKRGQVLTSITYLATRWGWNRRTVRRKLDTWDVDRCPLKCPDECPDLRPPHAARAALISIRNYDIYQGDQTGQKKSVSHSSAQMSAQISAHKQEYNNIRTDSAHKRAIKYWEDKYWNELGIKYQWIKRDFAHISSLLRTVGFDNYCRLVDYILTTDDPWFADGHRTLGILLNQQNQILQRLGKTDKRPADVPR